MDLGIVKGGLPCGYNAWLSGHKNSVALPGLCQIGLYLAGFLLHEGYTFLSEPVFRAIWKTEKQKSK